MFAPKMLHYSQYPHCLVCLEAMHIAHCACFKVCSIQGHAHYCRKVAGLVSLQFTDKRRSAFPPPPTMAAAASLLAARNRGEEDCPCCPAVREMQNTKYLQIQSLHTKYKVRLQNLNTKYKFLAVRNRGRERRIVPA